MEGGSQEPPVSSELSDRRALSSQRAVPNDRGEQHAHSSSDDDASDYGEAPTESVRRYSSYWRECLVRALLMQVRSQKRERKRQRQLWRIEVSSLS